MANKPPFNKRQSIGKLPDSPMAEAGSEKLSKDFPIKNNFGSKRADHYLQIEGFIEHAMTSRLVVRSELLKTLNSIASGGYWSSMMIAFKCDENLIEDIVSISRLHRNKDENAVSYKNDLNMARFAYLAPQVDERKRLLALTGVLTSQLILNGNHDVSLKNGYYQLRFSVHPVDLYQQRALAFFLQYLELAAPKCDWHLVLKVGETHLSHIPRTVILREGDILED